MDLYAPAGIGRSNAAPEGLVGQSEHPWIGFEARLVVSRPAPLDRRYLEGWWYRQPLPNRGGAPQDRKKHGEEGFSLDHTKKLVLKCIVVKGVWEAWEACGRLAGGRGRLRLTGVADSVQH